LGRLLHALAASAAIGLAASPAWAATARARVEGDMDPELRAAIERAIGDIDRPIDNRFEARRRAESAAQDAASVLRSEGYYAYQVEPDLGEGDMPAPAIRVTPGPRFHLARPKIDWVGATPDPVTELAAQAALALGPGAPGLAADVVSAEGRAVAAVQDGGYADVQALTREVVVDHADLTVQPTYRLAPGSLVKLDGVRVTTDGRTDTAWVQRLAPWRSGDLYKADDIVQLERRLLDTGVFDAVTVGLAPADQVTAAGLRPIVVSLSERKRRSIEAGASYGTNEGLGFDVRWTHYNVLRRADTFTLFAKSSKLDSRFGTDITLPHWRLPDQTLTLDAAAYRTTTDAYDATGVGVKADAQRHFTRTSYLTLGGLVDFSQSRELKPGTLTSLGRDVLTVGGLADLALDRSDDPLNPTRGWRVSGRAEPTLLAGKGTAPYLKVQAGGSVYWPFGAGAPTVIAARIHAGAILNGTVAEIPAPQRFFAGGGGSVRGFAYQGVGPRLADNTPQGGLSIVDGSFEVRHRLTRDWGLVGFVDAGAVGSDRFSLKQAGVGAGVGVRYDLGFAPIRVDVAVPVSGRRGGSPFQLYVSIGQAF
jgi:translocation and assembly module TamA